MKNFKNLILLFLFGAIGLSPMTLSADGVENDTSDPGEENITHEKSGRPKAPSRKNIVVNVEDGQLTIVFRQP